MGSLGMYGIRIATHQMMPKRKILAFSHEAIATGWRQPFELRRVFSCQLDTVRNTGTAIGVVSASTTFQIKQFAGDPGVIDAAILFILELLQAAQATAVAQRLPLGRIQLGQSLAHPEGFDFCRHENSHLKESCESSHCRGAGQARGSSERLSQR